MNVSKPGLELRLCDLGRPPAPLQASVASFENESTYVYFTGLSELLTMKVPGMEESLFPLPIPLCVSMKFLSGSHSSSNKEAYSQVTSKPSPPK